MHDSVTVKVLHGREHLAHDVSGVPLRELLSSHDPVEELTSLAVLHDDVYVAMIDVALIELDDVGVVALEQDVDLRLEHLDLVARGLLNDLQKASSDAERTQWGEAERVNAHPAAQTRARARIEPRGQSRARGQPRLCR